MKGRWRCHVETHAWKGTSELWLTIGSARGVHAVVQPFTILEGDQAVDLGKPTLSQTYEEQQDLVGDVDGFLQAVMDAAWEQGLRPRGFEDHTNELKATRFHLEDMRLLAKVRKAE